MVLVAPQSHDEISPKNRLDVPRTLLKARSLARTGAVHEAKTLYETVLLAFPNNLKAKKGIRDLNLGIRANSISPKELDPLLSMYSERRYQDVATKGEKLLTCYPEDVSLLNLLGVTYNEIGAFGLAAEKLKEAIALKPDYAAAHCNLGNVFEAQGRISDAIQCFKIATEIEPKFGAAHYNAGRAKKSQGKLEEALYFYRLAAEQLPDFAEAQNGLGVVLDDLGQFQEAINCYRKAIDLKPDFAEPHANLGNILQIGGQFHEAINCYQKAIDLKPDFVEAHNNLGNIFKIKGQFQEAINCYQKAIDLKPDFAEAHNNLGNIFKIKGQFQEAINCYQKAIDLKPDFAEAQNGLGVVLDDLGQFQEAINCYRKAIDLKPDFAEPHANLGNILQIGGQFHEAITCYQKAIDLKPDFVEAHNNLGNIFKIKGQFQEAINCYQKAIDLKPDFAEAHNNLGNVQEELGNLDLAQGQWLVASELSPETPLYWLKANLFFSDIYENQGEINKAREHYTEKLKKLREIKNSHKGPPKDHLIDPSIFWLAYQNCDDDRKILESLETALRASPYTQQLIFQPKKVPQIRTGNDKIRIGICSQFLGNHTIGRLNQGLVKALGRNDFDVTLISPPESKHDEIFKKLRKYSKNSIDLPSNPIAAAEIISRTNLDILFYPDIGMSPFTYHLALSRLARVQATSLGHPNTTGLSTIDYFISSSLIEPKGAQNNYTEKLVLLSRLPCIYEFRELPINREHLDEGVLPNDKFLIGIPQTLFKFHPQFDATLESIAQEIPDAIFILISGKNIKQNERFKARLLRNAPLFLSRTLFLPHLSREKYLSLLERLDIMLDPFYFGSGNTFYESMAVGTPFVTMPGTYMRARIVAGGYEQMGIGVAPIAQTPDEYVWWCKQLSLSEKMRRDLRNKIREAARESLFDDEKAEAELIHFFKTCNDRLHQDQLDTVCKI